MNFGKYKKAKYQLVIDTKVVYFFVTTIHSEEECIEILKEEAKFHRTSMKRYYSINKKEDTSNRTLFMGKLEPLG
jgi:hypothetical protein